MNWHYVKDNKQTGPVDHTELEALFRAGTINNNTLVWSPGMETWLPYSEARAEKPPATTGNEAVCAECGKTFDKGEMIRHGEAWVCAACKSVFLQKLSEGVEPVTGAMRYAGFWIRFVAKFLDGIIMSVLVLVPMIAIMASMGTFERSSEEPSQAEIIVQLVFQIVYFAVYGAYSIFFVGKYGATPGKMACKIKVVDGSGAKIGYARATGRFFAEFLSGLLCYIGYIMVAFDEEKRALHDRICNTRVVYK
jgi:uncharacterized RDD family membrane protein YckC/DNA-directed RNA polymerase subunit RPC12/RpoP